MEVLTPNSSQLATPVQQQASVNMSKGENLLRQPEDKLVAMGDSVIPATAQSIAPDLQGQAYCDTNLQFSN